jgi:uncharacterized protein
MAEHQGPRRHAMVQIIIDGTQDVTSKIFPYLISVQVVDTIEASHSTCSLELDDRNAELAIPPDGANLQVAMGWAGEGPHLFDSGRQSAGFASSEIGPSEFDRLQAPFGGPGLELLFTGWVQNVESGFGRKGGGRRLWIEATSGNVKGAIKERQSGSWGEGKKDDGESSSGERGDTAGEGGPTASGSGVGSPQSVTATGATDTSGGTDPMSGAPIGASRGTIPLKQVLEEMAKRAGVTIKMSPEMEKIAREYWHVDDSLQNFGQRMARELGGIFSINGGVASLVKKGAGKNVEGKNMPDVDAIWGINLIGWRIKPYAGRPQYGEAAGKFYNIMDGVHETVKKAIDSGGTPYGGSEAVAHQVAQVADKTTAEQANQGQEGTSKAEQSKGWILINGEPRARAGGTIFIDGARPGVDGGYLITTAEHNYTRTVGYTTRCEVMYPKPKTSGYDHWLPKGGKKPAKKKDEPDKLTARQLFQLKQEVDEALARLPATREQELERERLLEQQQDLELQIQRDLDRLRPTPPRVIG